MRKLFDKIYLLFTEFNPMASIEARKSYSEKIERLADEQATNAIKYTIKNLFNGKLSGLDEYEILEKYKKTL